MKIAEITHVFLPNIGGVENYVFRLARDLKTAGEDVEVLTSNFGIKNKETYLKANFKTLYFFSFPILLRNPFTIGLPLYLLKNNYDIIHVHSIHAFPSLIALIFKKKAKLIVTAHGVSPENHSILFKITWKLYQPVARLLCNRSDRIILLSQIEKEKMIKLLKICPSKIEVIPNGIDSYKLSSQEQIERFKNFYHLYNSIIILYVGRVSPIKNPELAIRAFARITPIIANAKLLMVGPVDTNYLTYLNSVAAKLNISNEVIFTGEVDHREIITAYNSSNIFVSLGAWEGLPTTMLEAMFFGLPCVMYNAGGISDVIKDGATGLIINELDDKIISERIMLLINNYELYCNISINAKQKIINEYLWDNSFDKIYNIYK